MTEHEAEEFAGIVARAFGKTKIDPEWVNGFVKGLRSATMSEAVDALDRIWEQGAREYAPNASIVAAEIREGRITAARTDAIENRRGDSTEGKRLTPRSAREIINRRFAKRLHELETPREPDIRPVPRISGETSIRYMLNGREYVRASPSYCQAYETQIRNMKEAAEAKRRADPKKIAAVEEMRREMLRKVGIE